MIESFSKERAVGEVWVDSLCSGSQGSTSEDGNLWQHAIQIISDMSEKLNIALLWVTSMALMADMLVVMYMMLAFKW